MELESTAPAVAAASPPVIVCDAVESIGVHNGVVRIAMLRLLADGGTAPSLELLVPVVAMPEIVRALQNVVV